MLTIRTMADLYKLSRLFYRHDKRHHNRWVIAFRMTRPTGRSYFFPLRRPVFVTEKGAKLRVPRADTNCVIGCGAGVNVATKSWVSCRTRWNDLCAWKVKFQVRDIAAIPYYTDGKFRLFQCTVIGRARTTSRKRRKSK